MPYLCTIGVRDRRAPHLALGDQFVVPILDRFWKKRPAEALPLEEKHYRDARRRHITRLSVTYVLPLLILTAYIFIQYRAIVAEGHRLHLQAIAESRASTLDLFLSERLVDLSNLLGDPKMTVPPPPALMEDDLAKLKRSSETFVDLGYFDASGQQVAYAGPYASLADTSYSSEPWYLALTRGESGYIITDTYLGFRKIPHFTIAMGREAEGRFSALRATLLPSKMYEYISSFSGAQDVVISIVNARGLYQLVPPRLGNPLEFSSFVPPPEPRLGVSQIAVNDESLACGYSWLRQADWALIVHDAPGAKRGIFSDVPLRLAAVAGIMFALSLGLVFYRAGRLVDLQIESDRTRLQLGQAAKLASIGELAAGIAHEINNPLAAISSEAGLVRDLMSSEFGEPPDPRELMPYLDSIQDLVMRCRDITHKLLRFVRSSDVNLSPEDLNTLIDEVVDDLLGNELMVSKVQLIKRYGVTMPQILTDGNQLEQVILNIVNNAVDAIGDSPGTIRISTEFGRGKFRIQISDTGKGMTGEQIEKAFLPFFSTKDVGKGTGLGLSVSYGIVKSLGGDIDVESTVGQGTTFNIVLPKSGEGMW